MSQKITIDLAHACLAAGATEQAQAIMRKVAAENNDNPRSSRTSKGLFADGACRQRPALLDQVGREIIEINNRGVMAARSGDLMKGRYVC